MGAEKQNEIWVDAAFSGAWSDCDQGEGWVRFVRAEWLVEARELLSEATKHLGVVGSAGSGHSPSPPTVGSAVIGGRMIRVKILYGGKTSPVVVYPKLALTRKKTQVIVRLDAKNADKPIAVIIERVGDDELDGCFDH